MVNWNEARATALEKRIAELEAEREEYDGADSRSEIARLKGEAESWTAEARSMHALLFERDAEIGTLKGLLKVLEELRAEQTQDIRWAVNLLLEKIALRFAENDTWDWATPPIRSVWRSDAAALIRSFKHEPPTCPHD